MQTTIHPDLKGLPIVAEANDILRRCVHCGFCTATCPTYQLLGDELDGPRGRIYLIKNLLEENIIDERAVQHLDRCLTCRACETTCPSGVQYGRLLDIGRELIAPRTRRPFLIRFKTWLLRLVVPRRYLFEPLLRLGQMVRFLMPANVKQKIPKKSGKLRVDREKSELLNQQATKQHLTKEHLTKEQLTKEQLTKEQLTKQPVLVLQGCVQRSTTPNTNQALENLLAAQGVGTVYLTQEGCCGALDYHLSAHDAGLNRMRELIDLILPKLDKVECVVSTASGCGVTVKEYPIYLADDPEYAAKAKRVAAATMDVSTLLSRYQFDCERLQVAVHTPCSLQHGQSIDGEIEKILSSAGMVLVKTSESHLCCGSAGTYSIMQPELAEALRDRKLEALSLDAPQCIVTANVGCQLHLQSGTSLPVMHWVELLWQQSVQR